MSNFIHAISRTILENGDSICAIDYQDSHLSINQTITYSELYNQAISLAANISEKISIKGDSTRPVIGIVIKNSINWMIADLACLISKVTALPLPLSFSKAQAIFLVNECDGFLVDAYGEDTLQKNWGINLAESKFIRVDNIENKNPLQVAPLLTNIDDEDWIVKIIHTSGTTSTPKGVKISSYSLQATLDSLRQEMPSKAFKNYLSLVPLSLLLEQITGVYLPLLSGGITHFLSTEIPLLGEKDVSIDLLIESIAKLKPSALTVPPIVLERLLKELISKGELSDELLKYFSIEPYITCGGASISKEILSELQKYGLAVFQGYGLSENTSVVSMNTPKYQKIGSVGKPLPHVKVRISTEQTIQIKSSSLFHGYSGRDPSACDFTDDNWLDTGDIGHIDDNGFLYVTGRKKNVICLPNGRNVSPEQIEIELLKHPAITAAAVVLAKDEQLAALIVSSSEINTIEIGDWSNSRFSTIECPSYFHILQKDADELKELFTVTGRPRRAEITNHLNSLPA